MSSYIWNCVLIVCVNGALLYHAATKNRINLHEIKYVPRIHVPAYVKLSHVVLFSSHTQMRIKMSESKNSAANSRGEFISKEKWNNVVFTVNLIRTRDGYSQSRTNKVTRWFLKTCIAWLKVVDRIRWLRLSCRRIPMRVTNVSEGCERTPLAWDYFICSPFYEWIKIQLTGPQLERNLCSTEYIQLKRLFVKSI